MKTLTLELDDLRVETFATGSSVGDPDAPEFLNTRTRDPKDCPETLPQFCAPTSLC